MIKLTDYKTKIVGYGSTQEEAREELSFNLIRNDISLSPAHLKRREDIYAWLPLRNVLSIKGKTTIVYKDNTFTDTETGEVVTVSPLALSHYMYLYYLLGKYISYEDFTITIAQEVDKFLLNISDVFGKINDFPYLEVNNDVKIKGIHIFPFGCFVGETEHGFSMAYKTTIVHLNTIDGIHNHCLISYGLARLGVGYNRYKAYVI